MLKTTPFFIVSIFLFLVSNPASSQLYWYESGTYHPSGSAACGSYQDNFAQHDIFMDLGFSVVSRPHPTKPPAHQCLYKKDGRSGAAGRSFIPALCMDKDLTNGQFIAYSAGHPACEESEDPPIDCNDTETVHEKAFHFENTSIGSEPDKLDHCSGPGGKGGCAMIEKGLTACTGGGASGGVSCFGQFQANGRCSISHGSSPDPDSKLPDGTEFKLVTPELAGDQLKTDKFDFDSAKLGNCTVDGTTVTCYPLAESNQTGTNNGKDLLVKAKGDTKGVEGLQQIATVQASNGKEFAIYDATVSKDNAVKGDFDNKKSGDGTGDGSGDGKGDGSGSGDGKGDGSGSGDCKPTNTTTTTKRVVTKPDGSTSDVWDDYTGGKPSTDTNNNTDTSTDGTTEGTTGSNTSSSNCDDSGSGSGSGSGDGSGDAPTSDAEEWGDNPDGVDTEAFQGEIDGYVSDLNKASDDLAQENEEKAQQVAEDMQGALLDYLMPDISYSGGCDLGTVNVNLFGSSGSAPLSLCPYLTIFETMGNIFFLFANISAVFIFIRTFTGTGA